MHESIPTTTPSIPRRARSTKQPVPLRASPPLHQGKTLRNFLVLRDKTLFTHPWLEGKHGVRRAGYPARRRCKTGDGRKTRKLSLEKTTATGSPARRHECVADTAPLGYRKNRSDAEKTEVQYIHLTAKSMRRGRQIVRRRAARASGAAPKFPGPTNANVKYFGIRELGSCGYLAVVGQEIGENARAGAYGSQAPQSRPDRSSHLRRSVGYSGVFVSGTCCDEKNKPLADRESGPLCSGRRNRGRRCAAVQLARRTFFL